MSQILCIDTFPDTLLGTDTNDAMTDKRVKKIKNATLMELSFWFWRQAMSKRSKCTAF